MHVWPALSVLPQAICLMCFSMFMPGSKITGDLPPSSSVMLACCFAAISAICAPTFGLPVKKIWSKGHAKSLSPISEPFPSRIAISSSGKSSLNIFARTALTCGVLNEGFAMMTFPAAMAEIIGFTSNKNG